jgi:SWI/SNF-related matrix-associated actin-dependent regulator of chromatin subfamily A member 5
MPPKTETILFAKLTTTQKDVYKSLLKRDASLLGNSEGGVSRASVANIAMQLRKCCNHPYLFQGVEDRTQDPLGVHVIDACGKLKLLDKLLSRLKQRGHRVLIFSQMTALLDVLEDVMAMRKYEFCRIDGNTSYEERDEYIQEYNRPNSPLFVFLLSTRAGGLGINLQTADTCILFDSDWNPQADLQAMDRCHRIGQTKPVHVYRLVTADTIEEKIVERAKKKLKLDAMIVQQGRLDHQKKPMGPDKNELLEAVTFGASAIFRADAPDMKDEDLDVILERGRERTKLLDDKLQTDDKGDMLDFKLDGGQYTQTFEGINYADRNKQDLDALKTAATVSSLEGPGERKKSAYNAQAVVNAQEYQAREAAKKKHPVPPKHRMPRLDDWAFLDVTRLEEIGKVETDAFTALLDDQAAYKAATETGVLDATVAAEKKKLLEAGFRHWTKERFMQWRRLSANHGRHDHENITKGLQKSSPDLTLKEIKAFHTAFYDKQKAKTWRNPAEYTRACRQIERGEKAAIDQKNNEGAFAELVQTSIDDGNALDALPIDGGGPACQIRDDERPYTRSEDRFLLTASYLLKDTDGHSLSAAMRSTDRFLFDRRIMGASASDLASRCASLRNKCETVRASRERQEQRRLDKKRAVRPAHVIEAELKALEPRLKQARREESSASLEYKRLEKEIRGLSNRSSPRPSLSVEPKQLRLKPFIYYVRERGAALVAKAELPDSRDLDPAADETLGLLEAQWAEENDEVKGKLLARAPASA